MEAPAAAGLAVLTAPEWIALLVLGALLVLDDTALAQTWLSQPLPAGMLAGALLGDVVTGAMVALPLQLVSLANLPVGQGYLCEPTAPAVGAAAAACAGGHALGPLDAAGLGAGSPVLGWLVLGTVLASLTGHPLLQWERRIHFLWMLAGHRSLRDGDLRRVETLQARALVLTAVRGAVATAVWVLVFGRLWLPLSAGLGPDLRQAAAWLPLAAVGVAFGVVMERHQPGRAWGWLLAGGAAGIAVVRLLG
ncbi:MAG: PTS sugar transporter subunit IIC [Candidatus Krumholzibacteriia bacterium]